MDDDGHIGEVVPRVVARYNRMLWIGQMTKGGVSFV
jgi:hypothetical protein